MASLWLRPGPLRSHLVVRMEKAVVECVGGGSGRRGGVPVDGGQRLLLRLSTGLLLHLFSTDQVEEQREDKARRGL